MLEFSQVLVDLKEKKIYRFRSKKAAETAAKNSCFAMREAKVLITGSRSRS
jgi:hypothetical protein